MEHAVHCTEGVGGFRWGGGGGGEGDCAVAD